MQWPEERVKRFTGVAVVHHIAVFSACKKSAKVSVCAFKQIIFCVCLREACAVSFSAFWQMEGLDFVFQLTYSIFLPVT